MASVVFLGNWGLGLEIVKVLHQNKEADIFLVISRYDESCTDLWFNCVYHYALDNSIGVCNELDININTLHAILMDNKPDLLITHSFMKILPKSIFSIPRLGTVNVHASLLPLYRGPAPSYWVLYNKEQKTGLTAHFMDEGMDTGPVICQSEIYLTGDESMPELLEKLKKLVPSLMFTMLSRIADPNFEPMPQNENLATYAPKPKI